MNLYENVSRMRNAFLAGIDSVLPHKLVRGCLKQENNRLIINGNEYPLQKNVYIVGFGKAVAGMVDPVVNRLVTPDSVSHLQRGIISVPFGSLQDMNCTIHAPEIEFLEGAKDNIPDEAAFTSAKKIVSLVESLEDDDLLLVLISGGGSALLPYPLPPLTLQEKTNIIRSLSRAGASITELNTVRKSLSRTKGGKLAELTKAQIVSFILSDIINSPLDMIASGPTLPNRDLPDATLKVLDKYGIMATEQLKSVLQRKAPTQPQMYPHVTNLIIGNNETALLGVKDSISHRTNNECQPIIVSSSLQGEASVIGERMADLATVIVDNLSCNSNDEKDLPDSLLEDLCINTDKKSVILDTIKTSRESGCGVCLIFGGETTVTVTGTGKGGRNQEMVLAASINLNERLKESSFCGEVMLLSGGTDGIDGPTDAAGAVTFWSRQHTHTISQVQEAQSEGLQPKAFLSDNDSYTYFSQLASGRDILKVGHTGTNVMDLQILFITPHK
ncbi:hypothetical protein Pcinc_005265 [Petrolisthes cinctipes]|uniref:Glycerate kinase n=1 Tax=Petrolisthes cinctipes TaxID=88211 RepID=A0AAE1GFG4_PETCI|nr:hypothetical protein Pcinc_005265 [Petrolisthes cinctipes]